VVAIEDYDFQIADFIDAQAKYEDAGLFTGWLLRRP
jgi:hypothetical protein